LRDKGIVESRALACKLVDGYGKAPPRIAFADAPLRSAQSTQGST
jgi:hypothetical protein